MNYLSSPNAKITILGVAVGLALEVFAYLLSKVFLGSVVFSTFLNYQWLAVAIAFIVVMVLACMFIIVGAGRSTTALIGGIISGIFVITVILFFGYGVGVIVGLALCLAGLGYAGYDASVRIDSMLKFSLRTLALPLLASLSIAMFCLIGGTVFDYISRVGFQSDFIINIITDKRIAEPVFEKVIDSYGNFSADQRNIIIKEAQNTFKDLATNLFKQTENSIIGPILGVVSILFFFQAFNFVFVYLAFFILYIIFKVLKFSGFIKVEVMQKEAEVLAI